MKNKQSASCKCNIDQLRDELHRLIECGQLGSDIVQERSQELDVLILAYYKQTKECQALKEP